MNSAGRVMASKSQTRIMPSKISTGVMDVPKPISTLKASPAAKPFKLANQYLKIHINF